MLYNKDLKIGFFRLITNILKKALKIPLLVPQAIFAHAKSSKTLIYM